MKAGIITTPNRQIYLPGMIEQIGPYVDELRIYNDQHKQGQPYNMARCMRDLLTTARGGEEVLIMTDDGITVQDWYERYMALKKQVKSGIYVFFNRRKERINRTDFLIVDLSQKQVF